jgi:hypothetical protein
MAVSRGLKTAKFSSSQAPDLGLLVRHDCTVAAARYAAARPASAQSQPLHYPADGSPDLITSSIPTAPRLTHCQTPRLDGRRSAALVSVLTIDAGDNPNHSTILGVERTVTD